MNPPCAPYTCYPVCWVGRPRPLLSGKSWVRRGGHFARTLVQRRSGTLRTPVENLVDTGEEPVFAFYLTIKSTESWHLVVSM